MPKRTRSARTTGPPSPTTSKRTSHASSLTDINALPDTVLSAIIRHLPWLDRIRVESLNRRWRQLSLTHGWSDVESFHCGYHTFNFKRGYSKENCRIRLSQLLTRCSNHVQSINLCPPFNWRSNELLKRCHNLRYVQFAGADIDANTVDSVRDGLRQGLK